MTIEDKRLITCLQHRLQELDVREPYIWRLHLSASEFKDLAKCLKESVASHGGSKSHLLTTDFAMTTITYLAEWYKRIYCGSEQGVKVVDFDSQELKALWETSGINIDKFVYRTEAGTHLWQYSMYVLGGLAIRHELGRNDKGRFLKALCRIYHGEEYTLENLDDASRAIAFRRSIAQKHSIYEYLREILDGNYQDDDEQTSTLIAQIRSANDEVLRSKFRFEWIIKFPKNAKTMNRRLRVWLKPEEVGGGMHQYLRYDRMRLWGISNPDDIKILHFGLRWLNGETIVADIDKKHSLITYTNTGDKNGFLAWGIDKYATSKHIPTKRITKLQVVAFDDNDNEYIAQEEPISDLLQVWRIEPWGEEWSSKQSAQHQTAVVFTDRWYTTTEPDSVRPFRDNEDDSREWNWCYIYDSITLTSGKEVVTLYNRIGYDQVTTRLYTDSIRYVKGGLVERYYIDDPEESEDYEVEELPLIFGSHDILVRHFATKDAIRDAKPDGEDAPELIEYKMRNGIYTEWTKDDAPGYGVVNVRVTVKGISSVHKMIFLQGITEKSPIVRDFDNQSVRYMSFDGHLKEQKDIPERTTNPLYPVIYVQVDRSEEYVELQVYRPVLWKEIVVDGHVAKHVENGETVNFPYVLRPRTVIHDFNRKGYAEYDFREMDNIYERLGDNDNAHLAKWAESSAVPATELDETAPEWLNITFGDAGYDGRQTLDFYYWNYDMNTPPMAVGYNHAVEKGSVVFQSMRNVNSELSCVCPRSMKSNPFGTKGVTISELTCYEVALEYGIYFFVLEPLRKMANKHTMVDKLYKPLMEKRGGKLTDYDVKALSRMEKELRFSWKRQGVIIENEI